MDCVVNAIVMQDIPMIEKERDCKDQIRRGWDCKDRIRNSEDPADKSKDKLFDASLHKEEDFIYGTKSLGAGNLVGRMVENHNVQYVNVTITVQVANVQTSATPGTSLGLPLPHHPFRRPEP
ncbi:hypothetical protein Q3G72_026969 [Acer saccharum]|nr:hypothetical protein Q3G72_026969 [Acer saccharum]